jgi:multiple sugar transport system permease protein
VNGDRGTGIPPRRTISSSGAAPYLFIAPAMAVVAVFGVLPLLASLGISLTDADTYFSRARFVGLANYARAFGDSAFAASWKVSLLFAALDVPACVGLALLAAALVGGASRRERFLRVVYLVPLVCSATVVGLAWKLFFDPTVGWGAMILREAGVPGAAIFSDPLLALPGVALMSVWRGFGALCLIFAAGMTRIPESLYEAAMIDGASSARRFLSVTLPGIRDLLWYAVITRAINSFQVFDLVYVVTGGGPARTTLTAVGYVYERAFASGTRLGYASALSELLFAAVLAAVILLRGRIAGEGSDIP